MSRLVLGFIPKNSNATVPNVNNSILHNFCSEHLRRAALESDFYEFAAINCRNVRLIHFRL